ncbi:MAG: hypothetical protein RL030_2760 [Pseudomonadota bacterium]|jgi:hypothetical protein
MEPVSTTVTAAKAGISLYEAGGFALLLLAVIVAGATLMARFLMALIRDLGTRLNAVQDQQTGLLVGVVQESTKAANDLRAEMAKQTGVIEQQTEALRARPCLVDTATIHKAGLPRVAGLILICLLLSGCWNDTRDQAVADQAASMFELGTALERGVDPAKAAAAIKVSAAAVIHAMGFTYAPAAEQIQALTAPKGTP